MLKSREEIFIKACKLYVSKEKSTIRSVSTESGLSKSTLHIFMHNNLKDLDLNLYKKVMKKLKLNNAIKHINGGIATKNKYLLIKNKQ